MLVLSGGRNVESGWFTFGSNMNLEAMLRVIGKWSLSGMAMIAENRVQGALLLGVQHQDTRSCLDTLGLFGGREVCRECGAVYGSGVRGGDSRALLREPDLVQKWQASQSLIAL